MRTKTKICHKCGTPIHIPHLFVLIHYLITKKKNYRFKCPQCGTHHSLFFYYNVVADNCDEELKRLNKDNPRMDINWRNP